MLTDQNEWERKFDLSRAVAEMMLQLRPREVEILRMRFWQGYAIKEVAQKLDKGIEYVRKTQKAALRKFRHPKRRGLLLTLR